MRAALAPPAASHRARVRSPSHRHPTTSSIPKPKRVVSYATNRRVFIPRATASRGDAEDDVGSGTKFAVNQWPPPHDALEQKGVGGVQLGVGTMGVAAGYLSACFVAVVVALKAVEILGMGPMTSGSPLTGVHIAGLSPPTAVLESLKVTSVAEALRFANLFGTAMYAHAGAITAGSRGMDLMGCLIVGAVTAVGGGTIRQILLGDLPVFWATSPEYLAVGAVASFATFWLWPRVPDALKYSREMYTALNVTDALALGCFVVVGASSALSLGFGPLVAVVSAVITSCAGGVLRDVFCAQPVRIMHSEQELYATCVVTGACVFLALAKFFPSAPVSIRVFLPVLVVAFARAASWTRRVTLPVYADRDPFSGTPSRRVL